MVLTAAFDQNFTFWPINNNNTLVTLIADMSISVRCDKAGARGQSIKSTCYANTALHGLQPDSSFELSSFEFPSQ